MQLCFLVIAMSELFDVTTDYILKGTEPERKTATEQVNALIFLSVAMAFHFIGLIVLFALG